MGAIMLDLCLGNGVGPFTLENQPSLYDIVHVKYFDEVACALLLSGENLDNFGDVKNILVEMGTYFRVHDDYLDCYGDPEFIGKENYGKSDPERVAKVKDLYKELNLEATKRLKELLQAKKSTRDAYGNKLQTPAF
ncbi:hypothetical protein ABZP36_014629 [Zizania latifolia]